MGSKSFFGIWELRVCIWGNNYVSGYTNSLLWCYEWHRMKLLIWAIEKAERVLTDASQQRIFYVPVDLTEATESLYMLKCFWAHLLKVFVFCRKQRCSVIRFLSFLTHICFLVFRFFSRGKLINPKHLYFLICWNITWRIGFSKGLLDASSRCSKQCSQGD